MQCVLQHCSHVLYNLINNLAAAVFSIFGAAVFVFLLQYLSGSVGTLPCRVTEFLVSQWMAKAVDDTAARSSVVAASKLTVI